MSINDLGSNLAGLMRLMNTIIEMDNIDAFKAIHPLLEKPIEYYEDIAIRCDSFKIFSYIRNEKDKNTENSINSNKEEIHTCLEFLYLRQSHKCISVVMKDLKINENIKQEIIKEIIKINSSYIFSFGGRAKMDARGNGLVLLALFQNDFKKTAEEIFNFSEISKEQKDNKIKFTFFSLFSSTPFEKVKILVDALPKTHPDYSIIMNKYQECKQLYYSSAPCFSRYIKPAHKIGLQEFYGMAAGKILSDIEFGESRMAIVKKLNSELSNIQSPIKDQFKNLPPSKNKNRLAAIALEKISDLNLSLRNKSGFGDLRKKVYGYTPVKNQYEFALPLIRDLFYFSNEVEIDKKNSSIYYNLYYNNLKLNRIQIVDDENSHGSPIFQWHHGLADIDETWPDIEDLFEEIWFMDLSPPGIGELNEYQNKLTIFYEKLAELSWLIGNTQPLERGTGTYAESIVALMHVRHGFKPPILKNNFPQLDVLNITFPLDTYKKIFPYFFEPLTIPKFMRLIDDEKIEMLPISEQIRHYLQAKSKIKNKHAIDESALTDIFEAHIKIDKFQSPIFSLFNKDHVDHEQQLLEIKAKNNCYYYVKFNQAQNSEEKLIVLWAIFNDQDTRELQLDIAKFICEDNFISCIQAKNEEIIENAFNYIKSIILENADPNVSKEKILENCEIEAKKIASTELRQVIKKK